MILLIKACDVAYKMTSHVTKPGDLKAPYTSLCKALIFLHVHRDKDFTG